MILLDANILVYSQVTDYPQHQAARLWLGEQVRMATPIAIPWDSLLAFVRLTTNRRVYRQPLTHTAAWGVVQRWLALDSVWIPLPTERHAAILGPFVRDVVRTPGDVMDAHLAALALEHDLTLVTTDRGFRRFPGLRWLNPLQP